VTQEKYNELLFLQLGNRIKGEFVMKMDESRKIVQIGSIGIVFNSILHPVVFREEA